ncbi:MAG TPA: hypothetical protein ENK21_05415 [Trueperaceae bacterium]|nr:hypothetical protein [Trueperaceae bacterium]
MNRELRRIQKKADEKKYKEKQKNRQKRISKLQNKRQQRKTKIVKNSKTKSSKSKFKTDRSRFAVRFAEVFTLFTAFFIGIQVFVPKSQSEIFSPQITQAIEITYYLFFGHFLMLSLLKRRVKYGLWYGLAAGLILTAGLQTANYLVNQTINLQVLAFGSAATIAGVALGQFFYKDLANEPDKSKVKDETADGKA